MKINLRKSTFALAIVMAAPLAQAITPADLGLTEDEVLTLTSGGRFSSPGVTFGSPSAYGLNWREVGVGVGGTYDPDSSGKKGDGSIALGVGFGDSADAVGLEVTAGLYSTLNQSGKDNFASDGGFGAKLHTELPYNTAVAVGIENVGRFGKFARQGRSSAYAVLTKFAALNPKGGFSYPVSMNVGFGNNRFLDRDNADQSANVFGGLSVGFHPRAAVVADWTGRDLNAGINYAPFTNCGFVVALGGVNLTKQDGAKAAYAANVGYTHRF